VYSPLGLRWPALLIRVSFPQGFWITLPARAWPVRGKGAPAGARPQADLPCGGRSMARYTLCLSRVLFWFDQRLCRRPRSGGCRCRRVAASALPSSALHQRADQCCGEVDGNRIANLLGNFGLIAGEFVRRLRIRETHRAGELFRFEHPESDVIGSGGCNWLGNRQLDTAGRAYGRRRLVNRTHARSLAGALAPSGDDAGEFPAVRTGHRGERLFEIASAVAAPAVCDWHDQPKAGPGRDRRQRLVGRTVCLAAAGAVVERDERRAEPPGHSRHWIVKWARTATALA